MLTWNVYIGDFSTRQIKKHNVFNHWGFLDDCKKAARKYAKDRESFEKAIKSSLMYWYWSKTEWEILIHQWPSRNGDPDLKVDVYDQVEQNWQHFADYVWDHAIELRRREKKGASK